MNIKTLFDLKLIFLISIFIVGMTIFHFYSKRHPINISPQDTKLNNEIKNNLANFKYINERISFFLQERMNLLLDGKLSFEEWIEYNKKNRYIDINGIKYYIFITERIKTPEAGAKDNFVLRVHADDQFINISWHDLLENVKDYFVSSKFSTDPDMMLNLFFSGDPHVVNDLDYYWIEPTTKNITKKHTKFLSHREFKDRKGILHNGVIIAIGYPVENLTDTYQIKYYDYIFHLVLGIIYLSVIFITVIIFQQNSLNKGFIKAIIFCAISMIYIIYYSSVYENQNSLAGEVNKLNNMDNGVLSASFLVGVNIFIITAIKSSLTNHLNKETSLIFAVSIILLLFSIFRITNYTSLKELIGIRVSSQFLFNYSVLLNSFILINYIIYIFFAKRVVY